MEVIGEAGDGLELLNLLKQSKLLPPMAIVDISMPNLSGIEATRRIKMIYPDIKILILSMHKDQEYLSHALSTGADGYLLKEDSDRELFKAIEMIRQGEFIFHRSFPPPATPAYRQAGVGERRRVRDKAYFLRYFSKT
jgi:DNA-binding NarL/FixJ family response regulator